MVVSPVGPPSTPYVFVTVGTTNFPALVDAASHASFLESAWRLGFKAVLIQHGTGLPPPQHAPAPSLAPRAALLSYGLKSDIGADVRGAGAVVSHAGAGSVFEALRSGRRLLIACNPALAGNHQQELADAMAAGAHCSVAGAPLSPASLAAGLREAAGRRFDPLPLPSPAAFLGAVQRAQQQAHAAALWRGVWFTLALAALALAYSLSPGAL